ncbi:electron transport complex subunit RsxE, partial [Aggregatibacter actinomycetemcomitans]|nr:electron transport complex subunit RsxE [Aggregatibacter actinomycetemcomitans]
MMDKLDETQELQQTEAKSAVDKKQRFLNAGS